MKVGEILKAKGSRVATVRPDLTVETICHRLKMENVGALVVSEDDKTILGMISERDIVQGLVAQGPALLDMRVDELMSLGVPTCQRDDSVTKAMEKMTRERVRYLPVLDDGRLCGIISIGDVVRVRLGETELEASVLREAYRAAR
ncbi:MAG TPA: CBS domain-containing protein [Alphaproteobacteria bacterium]|nr:CBS domain-containing protein [Alphaproteobacteria bacterium]